MSEYRSGAPRFGYRDQKEPLNSEVRVYKLSDEELENYRKGDKKMKLTKELYLEEKDNKVTDSEIKKKYGMNQNHLYDFKKKHDLIGLPKVNAKEETKTITINAGLKEKFEDSKEFKILTDKVKYLTENSKSLVEQIRKLEQENQRLDDENADLQNRYDALEQKYEFEVKNNVVYLEEEPDIGWEEMKDDAARYKAMHDKLLEYVKVVM